RSDPTAQPTSLRQAGSAHHSQGVNIARRYGVNLQRRLTLRTISGHPALPAIDTAANKRLAEDAARRAPTLVKDVQALLPLDPEKHRRVLVFSTGIVFPFLLVIVLPPALSQASSRDKLRKVCRHTLEGSSSSGAARRN
ncbi:MAG: hypothetical protein ABIY37_04690, partial [Devosia sp.]